MDWKAKLLEAALPYIIGIMVAALTYILGYLRDRWHLPKPIADLLANGEVMEIIQEGVVVGGTLSGMDGAAKQKYVREWARKAIQTHFGIAVPDSALNFLIEKVIADRKAGQVG